MVISKILNISKSHSVKVVTFGITIVILEILFHLFGIETKEYMLFSLNIHWSIFLFLFIMYGEYKFKMKPKETIKESWWLGILKTIGMYFGLFLVLILYVSISPSGEILFEESGKILVQDGSRIYVDSINNFYVYKHYKSIIALIVLLFIYIGIFFPLAYEIKSINE